VKELVFRVKMYPNSYSIWKGSVEKITVLLLNIAEVVPKRSVGNVSLVTIRLLGLDLYHRQKKKLKHHGFRHGHKDWREAIKGVSMLLKVQNTHKNKGCILKFRGGNGEEEETVLISQRLR